MHCHCFNYICRGLILSVCIAFHCCCNFSHPQSILSEDQTNLHRHAAQNAQDAILLAQERAQVFDAQVAIDRKVNKALSHAKVEEQVRDEEAEDSSATACPASMSGLIVDCEW